MEKLNNEETYLQIYFFRMMGWKIVGSIDPSQKKCVLMVMPHTSAHDF
jgi:hypothetical protein